MTTRTRFWLTMVLAAGTAVAAVPRSTLARLTCEELGTRRTARFEEVAARAIDRCVRRAARRDTACPDERLLAQLAGLRARVERTVARRCPDTDVGETLARLTADLLCAELGRCGPVGTISITVTGGAAASSDRASTTQAGATSRTLDVDAGTTGLAHDLRILEGASYTAELSECDGEADTLCQLHGATAGQPLGSPSPITAGGVPVCVTVDFASDVTGSIDLASGALTETARVEIGVHLGNFVDRPCPACVVADGDPELGEAGVCRGGPNDGAPCTVDGLADAGYGVHRATSHDCALGAAVATFSSLATATTEEVLVATSPASPSCRAAGFSNVKCLCDTCNDAANTPCASDADCGGAPGSCGGTRCHGGPRTGDPCQTSLDCTDAPTEYWPCVAAGAPTRPNSCTDAVCTPTANGGACLNGPFVLHCALEHFRACAHDGDCPASGDTCVAASLPCLPDPTVLTGTPDPPVGGLAEPTLVGSFCMGVADASVVNAAAGFPGPVTYVWPTVVTLDD